MSGKLYSRQSFGNKISQHYLFCKPKSWLRMAEKLNKAASILWKQFSDDHAYIVTNRGWYEERYVDIFSPYFLLASLSIENLLKGMAVKNDATLVQNGKLVGRIFTQHNLLDVAAHANVNLSQFEKELCDLASIYIKSDGKYPVHKTIADSTHQLNYSPVLVNNEYIQFYNRLMVLLMHDD